MLFRSGLPAPLRAAGSPGISAPGSGQASFETSSETASSESRRLVAARSLLRRGRPQAALEVLTSLAADFPSGALVQEREALTIEALLASGDRRSARRRALGFIARYPESPYAGDVREALK